LAPGRAETLVARGVPRRLPAAGGRRPRCPRPRGPNSGREVPGPQEPGGVRLRPRPRPQARRRRPISAPSTWNPARRRRRTWGWKPASHRVDYLLSVSRPAWPSPARHGAGLRRDIPPHGRSRLKGTQATATGDATTSRRLSFARSAGWPLTAPTAGSQSRWRAFPDHCSAGERRRPSPSARRLRFSAPARRRACPHGRTHLAEHMIEDLQNPAAPSPQDCFQ
jgi:hypothetical protein